MSVELEDIHEECGLFGVWGHPDAARLTYFGLHALQHRGQEGAGIVTNDHGRLIGHRGLGLLTQVFSDEQEFSRLSGEHAVGHVRYATAGSKSVDNIQPFLFRFHDGDMALCHNGNLTNCVSLRTKLEDEGAIFRSDSDTEVLMHLIRRSSQPDFMGQLKESLNIVHGGFAYLLMTEHALIGALDPNGFRPLSLGRMTNGAYVLASETCALDTVGAQLVRNIGPGEIIIVDDSGYRIEHYTDKTQLAICSMEFIYFARPDSNIYGINVHSARKRMGRKLAQEHPVDADMVIGVPNSSLSAASGYAEESGLPNEMGLIKNQYVARTFIQPTQELREQGVRMKLSAVRGVVEGKKVAIIDDSIVRGTTSKRIVRLLREAGAAEVHMLISSPPLKYPCFYGIDIATTKELIAAKKSVDDMRDYIGADSLGFLSLDGLVESIGMQEDAPYGGLCVAYFNGDYPTALDDYERDFLRSLTPEDRTRLPKYAREISRYADNEYRAQPAYGPTA
ncbi:amidophosphoribosyltransferase [Bifidobacterium tibiigranuli]|uniref:Amidophosphoribosyltransferase n=1 Tax=Bifidobacterium tibiigranuli TaxID=2172043 RepID=A0A5N6RYX8_9BIFI|nr:amidophosphoribosyltransferase [Bifidobacterium tibiigranuli]KAE8127129.1 amidophosphoribosyltransferase [Bifidobacterium tibiigranuli]KAE8127648.1 amidophosphoribosyltransferase [Bifidobacterium tibiigranuli]MCH3974200.1 amidophosphoribosyltransferase [Bifidobacterium tibiigranuli]MCH4188763.1 amidophosphoribosyltransferase [Bifidobacterium tibiigranuli]MCH4203332.1 amidophosphoribosyltransferase [Bifidobacterium tibiigranuli]